MKIIYKLFAFVILLCIITPSDCFSQSSDKVNHCVPVFISGEEGYKSFRIPAIVQTPKGDLLAFCEGRVNHAGDFGHIELVMKRSKDNGATWSKLQVVARNGKLQVCNPAPVFDLTDPHFPKGRLFLFYNTGDVSEADILAGKGDKRCWFITSTDNGYTWSDPVDITSLVKKTDWRYYANTPGHAIQLKAGLYKGRIYVAANHSFGNPQPHGKHYRAHGYYTDDHGKTFQLSNDIAYPGSNESMAVELTGGKLMMNSRNQQGDIKARLVSLSHDGGITWDTPQVDSVLIDPVCQGSILSLSEKDGQTILAFCNAADTIARNNLTLRISYDEGKNWHDKFLIYAPKQSQSQKTDYAAYSDLVRLDDTRIGILFEKDNYATIEFCIVNWTKHP